MLHENDKIRIHMIDWPQRREIKTRNHGQVFTITKHPETGALSIDWKRGLGSIVNTGSTLVPLTGFAWTVVFEDINSGKLYHNNAAFAGGVVELAPECNDLRRACAAGIA